jgi:glutathione S-transferase
MGMKLYDSALSPFAARVRIAVYAKNLPVERVAPPGGTGTPEYKRINPTGKVPALEVDGQVLAESEVINEYLEDRFPTPSLRPAEPLARARMRVLSRFGDLYLLPALGPLFAQMGGEKRDAKLVADRLAELAAKLDQLEQLLGAGPHAAGAELTLADASLVPMFFFLERVMPAVGGPSPFEGRPKLRAMQDAASRHPVIAKVLGEMAAAMAERQPAR